MARNSQKSYYEVLGIDQDSTEEDIRKAYRKLAMEWHPDRNKDIQAEERFKEINEAYQILMDPNKRATYDRFGRAGLDAEGGAQGRGFDGFDFPGGVGDIFDAFFGGFGSQNTSGPRRGDDLHYSMAISFQDAVFGVAKQLKLKRAEVCSSCSGSGANPGTMTDLCRNCHGSGQVKRTQSSLFGQFVQLVVCSGCKGEGSVLRSPCGTCKGIGNERREHTIEVRIPAGVDNGTQVRLGGEGEAGSKGGSSGSLYITLKVHPHRIFERSGQDILMEFPMNVARAALGQEISIPMMDGSEEKLNISGGAQTGQILKIKGKGVPSLNNGRRGDFLVRLKIVTPGSLSKHTRSLFEELADTLDVERSNGNTGSAWLEDIRDMLAHDRDES